MRHPLAALKEGVVLLLCCTLTWVDSRPQFSSGRCVPITDQNQKPAVICYPGEEVDPDPEPQVRSTACEQRLQLLEDRLATFELARAVHNNPPPVATRAAEPAVVPPSDLTKNLVFTYRNQRIEYDRDANTIYVYGPPGPPGPPGIKGR